MICQSKFGRLYAGRYCIILHLTTTHTTTLISHSIMISHHREHAQDPDLITFDPRNSHRGSLCACQNNGLEPKPTLSKPPTLHYSARSLEAVEFTISKWVHSQVHRVYCESTNKHFQLRQYLPPDFAGIILMWHRGKYSRGVYGKIGRLE